MATRQPSSRRAVVPRAPRPRRTAIALVAVAAAIALGALVVAGGLAARYGISGTPARPAAPVARSSNDVFVATVVNPLVPSKPAPPGMVWIPGGEFSMGAQDPPGMDRVGMQATEDSRPVHRVRVDGFWMDR